MGTEDAFDVRLIEEYSIRPEIKELTKKERFDLIDKMFKERYQGRVISYEVLEKEMFAKITAKTRMHFGAFDKKSGGGSYVYDGYIAKLNIAADGQLIDLVSNCEYKRSGEEMKSDQNNFHRNTKRWHYFGKDIMFEGDRYRVQVDVRENVNGDLTIYNVGLARIMQKRELEKLLLKNKERRTSNNSVRVATDLQDRSSSEGIVSQELEPVNRKNEKSLDNLIKNAANGFDALPVAKARGFSVHRPLLL